MHYGDKYKAMGDKYKAMEDKYKNTGDKYMAGKDAEQAASAVAANVQNSAQDFGTGGANRRE